MDTAESQSTNEPSTSTSIAEYNRNRSMDQISSPAGLRSMNTPAALYLANEMSPEMVMSDLNIYRPATTSLPLWNGVQSINYSTSVVTNGTHHTEQETATTNDILRPKSGSSNSYDVFQGEDGSTFQLSPKASFDSGHVSNHDSPSSDDDQEQDEDDENGTPFPKRRRRTAVPDEKKDEKYWARRKKNNDAAKRSRDQRRKKLDQELKSARDAITENQKLKQEIDVLKAEINSLRRLLKDANTTLSLWIRARQTAEPNVQLPPMLRSANVSYVNFPVSTTS